MGCQKTLSLSPSSPSTSFASEYWRMDESGSANRVGHVNGVILGTTDAAHLSSGAGIIGNAAVLTPNISSSAYQLFGDRFNNFGGPSWSGLSYPANKGFSLSLWLNCLVVPLGFILDFEFVMGDITANQTQGFFLATNTDLSHPAAYRIDFSFNMPPGPFTFGGGQTNILGYVPLGQWSHIVITYDQQANLIKFYGNGVLILTFIPATPWIVQPGLGIILHEQTYCQIAVDELGVWMDHVLTQAEVNFLYNSGNGNRPPNG